MHREFDLIISYDGTREHYLSEMLPFLDFRGLSPAAPSIERQTTTLATQHGLIQTSPNVRFQETSVKAKFNLSAKSHQQFYINRQEVIRAFKRVKPFYISTTYDPNRRWLVVCDDGIDIDKDNEKKDKEFEVDFKALKGLAESKFTTSKDFNLASEHFNVGMNIPSKDNIPYSFNSKSFTVFNGSDVALDTIQFDYQVKMKLSGKDVKITNKTTNESIVINGSVKNTQVIKCINQYVFIDDKIASKKGRFPSLEIGDNQFVIENATSVQIDFITRFYYV